MTEPRLCPHCRRPLRLGVRLSRTQARIFDVVVGGDGPSGEDIAAALPIVRSTVKVHIANMNERLAAAGWRIVGSKIAGYRLERWPS